MRRIILTTLLCAAAAYPAAALAQEKATRSVDDYLCAFAGKCGEEAAAEVTRDAPETKGFSLARPGASKAAPATRGFSLAKPKPAAATPTKAVGGARANASASASANATPARPAATARPAKAKQGYASASKAGLTKSVKSPRGDAAEKRADLRLSFEIGSASLTDQAMEEARVFAESLKRPELAPMKFRIEGHTDSQGGRAYNLDLSQRRAEAVADYLESLGVSRDRLEVRGYGYDRPLDGRSASAHENRRVEAVLTS